MKTNLASSRSLSAALLRRHSLVPALLAAFAVSSPLALSTSQAQTITSAVPALLSYQGRVTTPAGALVGAGTPVNRTVTFRIWSHATNSLASDLVYSEQQVATISEGEFSVLIGQGNATTGTPLGYSETTKGKPTVTIADTGVFGGAVRYLGVTVDDGNSGTIDPEISPRQQIVTSAFAFRAKYAESLGTNGSSTLTTLDNGNVGIGTATPGTKLDVNGAVRAGGGAGAVPSVATGGYMFSSGDTDGGIFSPADNTITFFTNNAERMRLVGDNLGLGTTNPLTRLDVNGAIAATAAGGYVFGAGDVDTGMFSSGDNHVLFKTGNVERLHIDNSGKVGIGVSAPAYTLDVRSATGAEMMIGDGGGKGALYFGNNAHGVKRNFGGVANDVGLYTSSGSLHLSSGGATAGQFVLNSNGDVGIGTSSPLARLHVSATNASGTTGFHVLPGTLYGVNTLNAVTLDVPGTASGMMAVWDNFGASGTVRSSGFTFNSPGDTDGGIFSPADGTMTFSTDAVERMRINSAGNVGIGTTTMTATLDVNGNIAAKGGYAFGYNDVDTGMFPLAGGDNNTIIFQTANLERVRFTSDGRVGIGTTSPTTALHVASFVTLTNNIQRYMDGNTNDGGAVSNHTDTYSITGDKRIRGAAFDVVSDQRIKNVIGRSSGSADLATLLQLQITDYRFKDTLEKTNRVEKKVIAQQVERVFPQAVNQTTDVVPDIFQKARIDAEGWVALATDLKVGERVRIVTGATHDVQEVLAVESGRFRTALKTATDQAFVYGREVSDFRTVDYDALAMLNVSATQQIKRDTDAEVKSLRAENAALRAELAALASRETARDAKLAAIEKLLSTAGTVMARPAPLPTATTEQ